MFHTNTSKLWNDGHPSLEVLLDDVAFLFPVSPVDLFYDIHIHYTEKELHRTEQQILRLEEEVKSSQNTVHSGKDPRRKYKSGDLDKIAIFDFFHKFINSTDQFYQYIDDTGKVYPDTCKLEKEELTTDGDIYDTVLQMAEEAVGPEAGDMESFAYRLVKPNVGIEYHFFFIEERNGNKKRKKKSLDDKVYQVTILKPYGELEIVAKEIHLVTTINIVLPVENYLDVTDIISQISNICSNQGKVHFDCAIFVIFQNDENKESTKQKLLGLDISDKTTSLKFQLLQAQIDITNFQKIFKLIDTHLNENSLIAFLDPHSIVTKRFLQRCILNSEKTQKAYFPIHFQLLHGIALDNVAMQNGINDISNRNGYWANAEYKTFCAYKEDISNVHVLPTTMKELVDDFTAGGIEIIRTAEPGLLKLWNNELCSGRKDFNVDRCIKEHRYDNLR